MSCPYCSARWAWKEPTEEDLAWYRRGAMMFIKNRLFPSRGQWQHGYMFWTHLEVLQRGLDNLCRDIAGGIGLLVPPLEMVVRKEMPQTIFLVTQDELRKFYNDYEGNPPIIVSTRSMV